MTDYTITVVDHQESSPAYRRRMERAEGLIRCGVPVAIADRWRKVRNVLGIRGLRRTLKERRN